MAVYRYGFVHSHLILSQSPHLSPPFNHWMGCLPAPIHALEPPLAAVVCAFLCVDNALFEEKKASVTLEPRDEKGTDFCLPPTCATAKPAQTAYSTAPTRWVCMT